MVGNCVSSLFCQDRIAESQETVLGAEGGRRRKAKGQNGESDQSRWDIDQY